MKQVISKRLLIAGIALLTVPSTLMAQEDKTKDKDKDKDKKVQTIVITNTSGDQGKMIIEVDGDKVKVNGKDVKDLKDVNVRVNTATVRPGNRLNRNTWAMSNDRISLFEEDENRAMLGVNTEDNEKGAEIQNITEGSAAAKAGLKKGDIITKVDDKKIEDADDLTEAIRSHKPADKVTVSYIRDGKEQKATAELGKWKGFHMDNIPMPKIEGMIDQWKHMDPVEAQGFGMNGNAFIFSGRPKLGLSIQDTDDGNGVVILEVEEESNAAKAGLKKDDIILSIDDKAVKGTEDVMKTIRAEKEKYNFNFKIQRGGKVQNVEVKFPKKLKKADL